MDLSHPDSKATSNNAREKSLVPKKNHPSPHALGAILKRWRLGRNRLKKMVVLKEEK